MGVVTYDDAGNAGEMSNVRMISLDRGRIRTTTTAATTTGETFFLITTVKGWGGSLLNKAPP